MKQFAELFLELDRTNKTNVKIELLKNYFSQAPEEDRIWALALFSGRRPAFKINRAQVKIWACEAAGIPGWLFDESYNSVGDLGETISLVLPENPGNMPDRSLAQWFSYLGELPGLTEEQKKERITGAWKQLSRHEIFVFNKLLMGSFRIGVSQTLVVRAVAEVTGIPANVVAHRIMGKWMPANTTYVQLLASENQNDDASQPYPFYLAYAMEGGAELLGNPSDWLVEWKWDGIRAQVIWRNKELFVWTRGEDLATDKFPELEALKGYLPDGTVLDGEIVAFKDGRPLPFNMLQTRIGRKNLSRRILAEVPVAFIAYDLLEYEGTDLRDRTQQERRAMLEKLCLELSHLPVISISPVISFDTWDELGALHGSSRLNHAEGFMLKNRQSTYQVGRKKGDWWKWKVDPLSVDAVLVYAQKGSGRRAELYTDYTFAVWNEDKLVPFAKAYSGLTDQEIAEVDRFIRQHTLEKFGPVRTVSPELVFEIGFEGINKSARHKSGIAVRFPRILRWRKDKRASEADTLQNLQAILQQFV